MDAIMKERHMNPGRCMLRRRGFKKANRFVRKLNKRAHVYKKNSVHLKEVFLRAILDISENTFIKEFTRLELLNFEKNSHFTK